MFATEGDFEMNHGSTLHCAIGGVACAVLLGACGGGGNSSDSGGATAQALKTGRFVDAAVEGLAYVCGSASGTTNGNGEFQYPEGASCTFRIGGITLGSAAAAALLTPVSLVPGASDETNVTVVNIVRLLISLDSDGNPANGITISPAVATALATAALNFAVDAGTFSAQAAPLVAQALAGRALAAAAAAAAHLNATLLGTLTGSYGCAYVGAASGNVTIAIANGTITGNGPNFTLAGRVASSGSATISGGATSTGATFTGTFAADGTGRGSWVDTSIGTGTWTCNRS